MNQMKREEDLTSRLSPSAKERADESQIAFLEQQIPSMASAATHSAYWNALTRGQRVVCAEHGALVEVSPDGSSRVLKPLPKDVSLPVGTELDAR